MTTATTDAGNQNASPAERGERLLERFFGAGNVIRTEGASYASLALRPWIDALRISRGNTPVVLARQRRIGASIEWYAMAADDRQFRALREDLVAAVGSTHTNFTATPAALDMNDAIDAAVR